MDTAFLPWKPPSLALTTFHHFPCTLKKNIMAISTPDTEL